MAKWLVGGSKTGNVQSVLTMQAAAANMRRAKVYDWTLGSGAAPTSATFIHLMQKCTTLPTGTGVTPRAADQADTLASTIVVNNLVTVDPTLTDIYMRKPLNQQNTFRWVAPQGGEILIPAVASSGVMLGLSAANATQMDYDAAFDEQ
jgi:hypothetical protein